METQSGGGGNGGEVRRIHVIYFLSRKGRIEHPHLIRVHHFSRNGVHLRDVKRWLSELRGKDMPESYSWSYKRRYKSGFVWQDLLDEDLITPISDNEFVLKGSEIPSNSFDLYSNGEKKVLMQKDSIVDSETHEKDHKPSSDEEAPEKVETKTSDSTKTSSEIEEESIVFGSETSTLTDDSMKFEQENVSGTNKQYKSEKSRTSEDFSLLYSNILSINNSKSSVKKSDCNKKTSNVEAQRTPASAASSSSFTKSKSSSNGKNSLFRNLINCGAIDTNDTAVVAMKKCENGACSLPRQGEICKGDKLGGSQRIFGTCWNQQDTLPNNGRRSCDGRKSSSNTKSDLNNQKPVSAAYKPVNYKPNCSQCGKMFRPDKMAAHMRSCRAMKSLGKFSVSASGGGIDSEPRRSSTSSRQDSGAIYFLRR